MNKYVFVADLFLQDYIGGAELTSDAILELKKEQTLQIYSSKVTSDFIYENKDKIWIFGNFASLSLENIILLIKLKVNYSIIEYDFKLCKFRSIEKHESISGCCDCLDTHYGKAIYLFFKNAKKTWFMSEKQREVYIQKKYVDYLDSEILSSVFSEKSLQDFKNLITTEKNNKYIILNSSSWIKGTKDCIEYANANNLDYELISNLSYDQMLLKIAKSKGLIFLPKGPDTCPRIVIEAKLLKCDLILNDYVLHKDEKWFAIDDLEITFDYLSNRVEKFWSYYE